MVRYSYSKKKNGLIRFLQNNNIGFRQFWYPVNHHKYYKSNLKDQFKNSYEVSRKGIWLPSNFEISDSDIKKICLLIRGYYNN